MSELEKIRRELEELRSEQSSRSNCRNCGKPVYTGFGRGFCCERCADDYYSTRGGQKEREDAMTAAEAEAEEAQRQKEAEQRKLEARNAPPSELSFTSNLIYLLGRLFKLALWCIGLYLAYLLVVWAVHHTGTIESPNQINSMQKSFDGTGKFK